MNSEHKHITYCVLACLSTLMPLWVGQSYFEAKSYNRITGAQVTTWDALWVDLMVQNHPIGE